MDYFIIILSLLLAVIGIIGCIFPGLPGLPINYIALLVFQYRFHAYSTNFLIVWAVITLVVLLLDYYFPIWTAKRFGATRAGITGSILGMLIGMVIPPVGMILGMIIGAVLGDILSGKKPHEALKSGFATFAGTLISIGFKLIASGFMFYYLVREVFRTGFK